MSKNVLLISVQSVKDRSTVHLNVDDKLLSPEIKACQDMYLVPALGSALYEHLQTGIAGNSLSDDEKDLRENYVADALINYVLAALPMSASFQFFSKGVIRQTDTNAELPSMSDLLSLSNGYKERAEYYRERLVKYLQKNRTLFPDYDSDADEDIKPASSGYSMQCYLGDD